MQRIKSGSLNKAILILVVCLLSNLSPGWTQNVPGLIDFENGNYMGAHTPVDNDPSGVDNGYFGTAYGVQFSCVDNSGNFAGWPRYAKIGGQQTAFASGITTPAYTTSKGGAECTGYVGSADHPAGTLLDEGCWFLTDDDGQITQNPNTLRIDYDIDIQACSEASGYLIDVDGQEVFHIKVFTTDMNDPEEEILLVSPNYTGSLPNVTVYSDPISPTGDSKSAYWEVNVSSIIQRIDIDYIGSGSSNVGIAFDEFSYCSTRCMVNGEFHLINPNDGSGEITAFDQSTTSNNATIVSRTWTIETIETDRVYYPGGTVFNHFLPESGHYLICLETIAVDKETGECCRDRHCDWIYVEVEETACSLDPGFTYFCYTDDCIFKFSGNQGNSNRNIRSWHWTFGDGTTGTGQSPFHTYSSPGQYEICLTLVGETGTGDDCCTETFCRTILFNCVGITYQELCDNIQQEDPGDDQTEGLMDNSGTLETAKKRSASSIGEMTLTPNPVMDVSELSFSIAEEDQMVSLVLVEAASGVQTILMSEHKMSIGQHNIPIDCRSLKPGIYVLLLHTEKESRTLRMVNM